ncbi:hypothetical protein PO250_02010 [Limosilactobacillus mucosae]|uniref:Uncharacterized protein n=1 Tax=Limosilactobacillus mucosae TaxID=97478 RepID=A0AAJ1HR07_LIMMU|nr:hypothetical protein [Limosilactobacillus mucosae]MDC2829111.1 hypothetical protein [Limosilactobacillus mucosae]
MANLLVITGRISEPVEVKESRKGNHYANVVLLNCENNFENRIPIIFFNEICEKLQKVPLNTMLLITARVQTHTYNDVSQLSIHAVSFEILAPSSSSSVLLDKKTSDVPKNSDNLPNSDEKELENINNAKASANSASTSDADTSFPDFDFDETDFDF